MFMPGRVQLVAGYVRIVHAIYLKVQFLTAEINILNKGGSVMQTNDRTFLLQVEKARQKLYQTQQRYGILTHPKVVEQSVALDHLLNQYSYPQRIS